MIRNRIGIQGKPKPHGQAAGSEPGAAGAEGTGTEPGTPGAPGTPRGAPRRASVSDNFKPRTPGSSTSSLKPDHLPLPPPLYLETDKAGGVLRTSTGGGPKAWCLLIHAEASLSASLSHGDHGESLVPPDSRESVSLTGGGAKACCLLMHAEASVCHFVLLR